MWLKVTHMLAWSPGGCSVSSAGRFFGSLTRVGVGVSGRGVQAAVLVHWLLFWGVKSNSSCNCSTSMNPGLRHYAGLFFRTSSFTAGMFLEGAGIILSQILITPIGGRDIKGSARHWNYHSWCGSQYQNNFEVPCCSFVSPTKAPAAPGFEVRWSWFCMYRWPWTGFPLIGWPDTLNKGHLSVSTLVWRHFWVHSCVKITSN